MVKSFLRFEDSFQISVKNKMTSGFSNRYQIDISSLIDSRDDLLSSNLYAYCRNLPTLFIDPDGTAFFHGVIIPFWGYFHQKVLNDVQRLNPELKADKSLFSGSLLRPDLENPRTGEIYEIKPDYDYYYKHTDHLWRKLWQNTVIRSHTVFLSEQ